MTAGDTKLRGSVNVPEGRKEPDHPHQVPTEEPGEDGQRPMG